MGSINCTYFYLKGVMAGDEILSVNDIEVTEVENAVEDLREALKGKSGICLVLTSFWKRKNSNSILEHRLLHRVEMIFYTLHNCAKFAIEKSTVGSFDKENKFKPCFKLNIFTTFYLFKLWYEWGISWGICQQYNCFTWLF